MVRDHDRGSDQHASNDGGYGLVHGAPNRKYDSSYRRIFAKSGGGRKLALQQLAQQWCIIFSGATVMRLRLQRAH
jgi:hypothetical protein